MKYLKYFKTEAGYASYKNGSDIPKKTTQIFILMIGRQ